MRRVELRCVLDASAILAYLQQEPGYRIVKAELEAGGACVSAVNLAEVYTRVVARGRRIEPISNRLPALGLTTLPFLPEDAEAVAELRPRTAEFGLSLGDRACLALARRLSLPALTTDRVWKDLRKIDISVRLVR